jgi:glutathione S-transferase
MPVADLPVLYTFRRCPYAIRARLALRYTGLNVALREVVLRDKPEEMLVSSPKGTVPVLVLDEHKETQEIIDESFDIMLWALAQHDPDGWLDVDKELVLQLVEANDEQFKPWLDRYKYPDRYTDVEPDESLAHCEVYLQVLNDRLQINKYLCGETVSMADMSIYSFVRQFAFVDPDWFRNSTYTEVNGWLQSFLDSPLFLSVMDKYPQWHVDDEVICF